MPSEPSESSAEGSKLHSELSESIIECSYMLSELSECTSEGSETLSEVSESFVEGSTLLSETSDGIFKNKKLLFAHRQTEIVIVNVIYSEWREIVGFHYLTGLSVDLCAENQWSVRFASQIYAVNFKYTIVMLKIIEKVFNSVKCKLAQLNSTLSWANFI